MVKPGKIKFDSKADLTVPVLVDDVKRDEGFAMTRCLYFSVESTDSTAEPWRLGLKGPDLSLLMTDFGGVISRPKPKKELFETPGQVDRLFNRIEDGTSLVVETAHIWLPNDLPVQGGGLVAELRRGQVLRLGRDPFRLSHRFASQTMDPERFAEQMHQKAQQIRLSPGETKVFADWGRRQFQEARKRYVELKQSGAVLGWRDPDGRIQPG
ncbi:MAG: hypothetical protein R3236_09100 [Phycisphaeraceae bacterium]|nr:hypothetical protein [Phycisphaeraceae bacterium]